MARQLVLVRPLTSEMGAEPLISEMGAEPMAFPTRVACGCRCHVLEMLLDSERERALEMAHAVEMEASLCRSHQQWPRQHRL